MRRIAPFLAIALALLVPAWPAGAATGHRRASPKCPRANVRPVLADSQAEVYLAPEDLALPEFLGFYGCSFRHKRSYLLGSPPAYSSTSGGGIRLATLAGSMVAYEAGSASSHYGTSWLVVVRDLGSGKVQHRLPTGTPVHPEPARIEDGITKQNTGIGPATAIVVKTDGAVAWIAQDAVEGALPYAYQVHAVDKTGSRLLASGPGIDPASLALAGSTLYWTEDGKPSSATLN
jgi:hypothetical protein